MQIRPGDFENEKVQSLLRLHVEGMHAASPPGTCFVLDLSGLKIPEISFFTAWDGKYGKITCLTSSHIVMS